MGFDDNTGGTMPRRSATFSVEHGFVSTRTQTDSSYTELRGGGATVPQGGAVVLDREQPDTDVHAVSLDWTNHPYLERLSRAWRPKPFTWAIHLGRAGHIAGFSSKPCKNHPNGVYWRES